MGLGLFKYINFKIFIISLAIGLFGVYVTMPDTRKIYVYPTPENIDILQYKDKTSNCFRYKQTAVTCPKDESKISKIPAQS
jgi:hypothetical protein